MFKFLNTKYDAKISDISACSVELLKKSRDSHMVFMIASTFGNGDAPTTAKDFAAELKKTVAGSAGRRELENLK